MINLNDINIIIPAIKNNRHSQLGDFDFLGDMTLLEWKISQAKKITKVKKIFVTGQDESIDKICKKNGIIFLKRKKKLSLSLLYKSIGKKFFNKYILWLNPSYPFYNEKNIHSFLKNSIKKMNMKNDSAVSCYLEKEYFCYKKNPINFDPTKKIVSRDKITPLVKIINAAHLTKGNLMFKNYSLFGLKTYLCPSNYASSIEIKNDKNSNIRNLMLINNVKDTI
jgi:CMP-N-acetylneuraminic acid synthetase